MATKSKAWKCVVCGYVHRGDEAPDVCPVCGASAEDFEAFQEAPSEASVKSASWRCLICGYIHEGPSPPEVCPVCGAGSDEFEGVEEEPVRVISSGDTRKIVIIGGGIAGVSAAEAARQALPQAEISMLSAEAALPYYRLNLTRRLAGELGDEALILHPESWYEEQGIALLRGKKAVSVELDSHLVSTEDGQAIPFDKLILACGAHPFIPPVPGAEKEGVSAIRTLDDVHTLLERIHAGSPCVCIGGGILGLETAGALARHGAKVTLLEGFGYLLPRQLNEAAARVLEGHLQTLGIKILAPAKTKAIEDAGDGLAVTLEDGTRLQASAVTITTGIRANTHLARRAGIHVNQGIIVDAYMAASHPDVYAAGDCAEYAGAIAGLWEPAQYQGAIAGRNAAGAIAEFGGIPRMNTLKVLGVKLFSIGVIQPDDGSYMEISEEHDGVYRRFLFHDNMLAGAILVGDTSLASATTRAVRDRLDCSALYAANATADDVANFLMRLL